MKKISLWARHHQWTARIAIVTIYVLLNAIAIFTGDVLESMNRHLPAYLPYLLLLPFVAALCLYPDRERKKAYINFYLRQKCTDGVLLLTTLLLLVCIGNGTLLHTPTSFLQANAAPAVAIEKTNIRSILPKPGKPSLSIRAMRKMLKENIKQLRKEYRRASGGGKTGLIILVTLMAVFLFFLLIALSCSISCSGAEGLALFVFIAGTGLLVFLTYRLIRHINRTHKRRTEVGT